MVGVDVQEECGVGAPDVVLASAARRVVAVDATVGADDEDVLPAARSGAVRGEAAQYSNQWVQRGARDDLSRGAVLQGVLGSMAPTLGGRV